MFPPIGSETWLVTGCGDMHMQADYEQLQAAGGAEQAEEGADADAGDAAVPEPAADNMAAEVGD